MTTIDKDHAQVAPILWAYDEFLGKFPHAQLIANKRQEFVDYYQGEFEEQAADVLVHTASGVHLKDRYNEEMETLPNIIDLYAVMGSEIEKIAEVKQISSLENLLEPVLDYTELTSDINKMNLGNSNVALKSKYKNQDLFTNQSLSLYLVDINDNSHAIAFAHASYRYAEDKTGKITGDEDLKALAEVPNIELLYDKITDLEESGKLKETFKNLEKDGKSQRKKVEYNLPKYNSFHDMAHWFLQEQSTDPGKDADYKTTEFQRIKRILEGSQPYKEKRSKKKIAAIAALIFALVVSPFIINRLVDDDDDEESGNAHRPRVYIDLEKSGATGLDVTCDVQDPLDAQPDANQLEILVESMGVELYKRVVDIPGVGVYKETLPLDEIEAKQIVLKQNAGQDLDVSVRAYDDKGFGEDAERFNDDAPLRDMNLVEFYQIIHNLQKDNTPEAQETLGKLADAYQDPTPKRLIANETLNVFVDHITGEALGISETDDNDYLTIKDSSFLADIENRVDNDLSKTMEALGDLVMDLNEGNNGGLSAGTIDDFYHGTLIDSLRESAIADVLEQVFEEGTGVEAYKVFNFGVTKRIDNETYMIEPSWGLAFMEDGKEVVYDIRSNSIIPKESFIIDEDSFNNAPVEEQGFVKLHDLHVALQNEEFYDELYHVLTKRGLNVNNIIGEIIASEEIRDDQTKLTTEPVEITVGKVGEL